MRKTRKHGIKYLCKKALAVVLSGILTVGLLADLGSVKAASVTDGEIGRATAERWAGSGTEEDPWIIENSEDLEWLAERVNAGNKYNEKFFKISDEAQNLRLTKPIGYRINYQEFRGTFDGNGKTIELEIMGDDTLLGCGLFGALAAGAHVKNVRVTGSVSGTAYTAGIAAWVSGSTIENCVNEANISGSYVAGIAVFNNNAEQNATIRNCYNSGTITGVCGAGGIAANVGFDVQYCYNIGDVTNEGNHVAGILGTGSSGSSDSKEYEVSNCISLSLKVSTERTPTTSWPDDTKRVVSNGVYSKRITMSNNKARSDMEIGLVGQEKEATTDIGHDQKNGESISVSGSRQTSYVFKGWDPNIWNIPTGAFVIGCDLPTLKTVPVEVNPVLPGVPAHQHDFKWKFDTTYHWHECDCGQNGNDKALHTMDSGTVDEAAGKKVFRCTDECGYEYTETLPATGGKPEGGNTDVSGGDAENPDVGGDDSKPESPDVSGGDLKPENPDVSGGGSKPENPDISGGGSDQPTGKPDDSTGGAVDDPAGDSNNSGGVTDDPANSSDTPADAPSHGSGEHDGDSSDDKNTNTENVTIAAAGGNGGSGRADRPGAGREPKTGDTSHTEYWATLAMIAGFGYLLCLFMDQAKGMTEEEKNEKVAALIAWAKRGGRMRRYAALAVIFLLLVYYHSIGKQTADGWQKLYQA